MGLATSFLINNRHYVIPMATEEASIIAAASNAAKTIASAGGFTTTQLGSIMIGQIIINTQINDPNKVSILLKEKD